MEPTVIYTIKVAVPLVDNRQLNKEDETTKEQIKELVAEDMFNIVSIEID